jgi:hypothetical protein
MRGCWRGLTPVGGGHEIYQSPASGRTCCDDWFGAGSECASRSFPERVATCSRVIRCRHKAVWTSVQAAASPAARRVFSPPWCGITCALVVHVDGRWRAMETLTVQRMERVALSLIVRPTKTKGRDDSRQALGLIRKHGIVLESARGPAPLRWPLAPSPQPLVAFLALGGTVQPSRDAGRGPRVFPRQVVLTAPPRSWRPPRGRPALPRTGGRLRPRHRRCRSSMWRHAVATAAQGECVRLPCDVSFDLHCSVSERPQEGCP